MEVEQQRCPVTHCSAGWSMVLYVLRRNAWHAQGCTSKVPRVVSSAGSAFAKATLPGSTHACTQGHRNSCILVVSASHIVTTLDEE